MADIFVSYARPQHDAVAALVAVLERNGWRVWWDTKGLHGGDEFRQAIEAELTVCRCVIVLWSKEVGLIRFRRRQMKGGYDGSHGEWIEEAAGTA